jgi:hypothetical protein
MPIGKELEKWNYYSPMWAHVGIEKTPDGTRCLALHDSDPFDYAFAERAIPETKRLIADFTVIPGQNNTGMMDIEFRNAHDAAAIRLTFDSTGVITAKTGYRYKSILKYEAGKSYHIIVKLNTDNRFYTVNINGKDVLRALFFAPVLRVEQVIFRTGDVRWFPNADTPTDQDYDLPHAGDKAPPAVFYIKSFKTSAY